MSIQNNIQGLRAEVLLNYLYPELMQRWMANCKGTFYRNYSEDAIRIDEEGGWVTLSRDGLLKLLPQGLITTEQELQSKDFKGKHERLRQRKARLEELFRPFDSWVLRRNLRSEEKLAELLENKLDILLETYFHLNRKDEKNAYVRQMMALLPVVNRRRGDIHTVCNVLQTLTGHRVTMKTGQYNHTGRKNGNQPLVEYQIWMPSLDNITYNDKQNQMEELGRFIQEWFMPFDTKCLIELKCNRLAAMGVGFTLNYNTRTDERH